MVEPKDPNYPWPARYPLPFPLECATDRVQDGQILVAQCPEVFEAFRALFQIETPDRLLEIGTGNGGLTVALREMLPLVRFLTMDIERQPYFDALFGPLGIEYRQNGLVLSAQGTVATFEQSIVDFIEAPGRVYVLCDNGSKAAEVRALVPCLKVGDVIMAHDYMGHPNHSWWRWSEIAESDVAEICDRYDLSPYQMDLMGPVLWLSMKRGMSRG